MFDSTANHPLPVNFALKAGNMTTHMVTVEKFQGCLMGLGLGDALCAAREGGLPEMFLWKIIGKTKNGLHRYTDDTQMTIDLAAHLVNNGSINQDVLALDFARSYKWSRGYGPSTAFVLNKIRAGADWQTASTSKYSSGSFGNGAAMRIPAVALFFHNRQQELSEAIERSSSITHPNSLAITGAALIAQAVIHGLYDREPASAIRSMIAACKSEDFLIPMTVVRECLLAGNIPNPVSLRRILGTGTSAIDSCPASILIGMYFRTHPIRNLLGYVNKCKGDTDTIGAMSGSIWGAYNGIEHIPTKEIESIEGHSVLLDLAASLYEKASNK
jgi:poly(ADP-ribose) glycohydrolase ARH3